jgi:hypothetical protein
MKILVQLLVNGRISVAHEHLSHGKVSTRGQHGFNISFGHYVGISDDHNELDYSFCNSFKPLRKKRNKCEEEKINITMNVLPHYEEEYNYKKVY